ncbi:hypothetical protein TKK_0006239 [Trichogramma kaykai]
MFMGAFNEPSRLKIFSGQYFFMQSLVIPSSEHQQELQSFFWCQKRNLDTIRLYLQNIDIDSEEIEYIKNASIQLIKSNTALYTDKPRTNTISQIEGHPINGITDDEETLPPIPDMPLEHVDPPSVVSIPVDQGFLSRYSPNEVVLGKRNGERGSLIGRRCKSFYGRRNRSRWCLSLCLGLSEVAFKNAVKFASAELN